MNLPKLIDLSEKVAQRYFSNSSIFLLLGLILGIPLRWLTVEGRLFPLNDGGFWYVFTNAILSNNFSLPSTVYFNGDEIPTYYPPLAAYLLAALSKLLSIEVLTLLVWVPFFLSVAMIPAFYFFVKRLYLESDNPKIAVIIFALLPNSYRWFVMGGGVSRSLGTIFMLCGLGILLRKHLNRSQKILAGFLVGLALLSHPVAGFLTFVALVILILQSRISLKTSLHVALIAAGFALPWLTIVISRVSIAPFIRAFSSGEQGLLEPLKILLAINIHPPLSILSAFSLVGFLYGVMQLRRFSIIFLLAMAVFTPLFISCGIGCVPLALLCTEGVALFTAQMRGGISNENSVLFKAYPIVAFIFTFVAFINSAQMARVIASQSMTNEEFSQLRSIYIPSGSSNILVLTKHQIIGDAVGEWLGSFTRHRSIITHQMGEWNGTKNNLLEKQEQLELTTSINFCTKLNDFYLSFPSLNYVLFSTRRDQAVMWWLHNKNSDKSFLLKSRPEMITYCSSQGRGKDVSAN